MSSEFQSEEYKRGFIIGMAMNPLFVTTETEQPAIAGGDGAFRVEPGGVRFGVVENVIRVTAET